MTASRLSSPAEVCHLSVTPEGKPSGRFAAQLKSRRIPTAVCIEFSGDPRSLAHEIAGLVLCASHAFCRRCLACQKLLHGNSPNFLLLEPEGTQGLTLDQLRGDLFPTLYHAREEDCLIFLTECATLRREPSAALLKVLEEPPPKVHFFLITHAASALFPTLLSRCLRVKAASAPLTEAWPGSILSFFLPVGEQEVELPPFAWKLYRDWPRQKKNFVESLVGKASTAGSHSLSQKRALKLLLTSLSLYARDSALSLTQYSPEPAPSPWAKPWQAVQTLLLANRLVDRNFYTPLLLTALQVSLEAGSPIFPH